MIDEHPGPDPRQIVTRREFGAALTQLRNTHRSSVRELAKVLEVPTSTLGGYFAGHHLPALKPSDLLERLLKECGVTEPAALEAWNRAYWRVRRGAGHPEGPARGDNSGGQPHDLAGADPTIAISLRPPLGLLDNGPTVRGRDLLLDHLDHLIAPSTRSPDRAGVHVLHGLGGCGKSTVALMLAQRMLAAGVRVWWIAADSAPSVIASMHALAVDLGASRDHLRFGSLPDLLWRQLSLLDEPWLLIYDNADDPSDTLALTGHPLLDGTGWLRPADRNVGTILVTSRDGSRGTWGNSQPTLQMHQIAGLGPEDGGKVLLELTGGRAGALPAATTLAGRLGGLPLALTLAGRYLAGVLEMPATFSPDQPRNFGAYAQALRHGRRRDLFTPRLTRASLVRPAHVTLGQSWELSLKLLRSRGLAHAETLLKTLACLGPTPVPYELVLRPGILATSPLFSTPDSTTGHAVWEALHALDGLGLIGLEPDQHLLSMHPLVRDMSRQHSDVRRDIDQYVALTTSLLGPVVEDIDPKSPDSWERWRLLSPHSAAPLELIDGHDVASCTAAPIAVELAQRAASYQRAAGHLLRAENTYTAALGMAQRMFAATHPVVLEISHDLARLRFDQGRLTQAEQLFRRVVAARVTTLGDSHPDTLTSQHYLARTLRDHGRLDEADALFLSTLRARRRILGDHHPDTLTSSNGVADMLRARGRLAAARVAYQDVLAARTTVLGERHPATLVTRHYLADVRRDSADDLAAVESELRWLIAANTDVRGADHPRTLAVRQSLCDVLHGLGRHRDALELVQSLVETRGRLLGTNHPATLASRFRLGLIQLDLGAAQDARRTLQAVLTERRRRLGSAHPDTVLTEEAVARARLAR